MIVAALSPSRPTELPSGWSARLDLDVAILDASENRLASQRVSGFTVKPPMKPRCVVPGLLPLESVLSDKRKHLADGKRLVLAVDVSVLSETVSQNERLAALDRPKPVSSDQAVAICPHCEAPFEIDEGNCNVFRHAVDKRTLRPIPPHTPEAECLKLVREEKVYGCAKPLRVRFDVFSAAWIAERCDYI